MADPSITDNLLVELDETDARLRVWHGERLIGEMRPDIRATPASEVDDPRWTGWLSCLAVIELAAAYRAAVALGINRMGQVADEGARDKGDAA